MASSSTSASEPPKAILFDIGGVVVNSPMAAIAEYERSQSMPPGWINFSISRSGQSGSWAKLERGEVKLDAKFFEAFNQDLSDEKLWKEFAAKRPGIGRDNGKDGVSSSTTSTAALNAGGADIPTQQLPPVPTVNAEWLFWEMMRISRDPDTYMFAALKTLKASNRFLIAALSNTSIFPPGHPYNDPPQDPALNVKGMFRPFVSSAHVGMRKPEPRIYQLALKMMREEWAAQGNKGELAPGDILFLDDTGTNLAQGRRTGFRTLKVILGDTKSAVKELEKITGMQLLDDTAAKL